MHHLTCAMVEDEIVQIDINQGGEEEADVFRWTELYTLIRGCKALGAHGLPTISVGGAMQNHTQPSPRQA